MSALDRRATIDSGHQARLDALADALTETVYQRILSDPAFVEAVAARVVAEQRQANLTIREGILQLLRAHESAHGLPSSVLRKRDMT